MTNKLLKYTFVSEVPKDFVVLPAFLGGERGEYIHNEVVKKYGKINDLVTANINFSDGIVKGSKPGYVVAVNEILREEGLRTATQADLEKVLREKSLKLEGSYEDSALVLGSKGESNSYSYLAEHLASQISKDKDYPIMIPLTEVNLVEDSNSPYGLVFDLRKDAQVIYALILNNGGKFKSTNEDTGLPMQLGEGNRTLFVRDSDLSRLCLYNGFDLYSGYGDFAGLRNDGRVVVCG